MGWWVDWGVDVDSYVFDCQFDCIVGDGILCEEIGECFGYVLFMGIWIV